MLEGSGAVVLDPMLCAGLFGYLAHMSRKLDVEEQIACTYVAIEHLQKGRSTIELSDELGLSRFMVGRMIKRARDEGLVEVVARPVDPIDSALSKSLERAYGLDAAVVVTETGLGEEVLRRTIAGVGAKLLAERIQDDDVVGFGPGRTIMQLLDLLDELADCDVVQLTGIASEDPEESLQAILGLRGVTDGSVYPLYAPLLVTDAAAARAITAQPAVRRALQRMDRLDTVVLTLGGWPSGSLLAQRLEAAGELEGLLAAGAVAEIGTTVLDADGRALDLLADRLIGITAEQIRAAGTRIALGGGPEKHEAVVAVLRSGLIDVLVTDVGAAEHALRQAG